MLRDEAAAAVDRGKFKRAVELFLELEHLEGRDASWPKRAAEMYRRLGKTREAIATYERAAEKYAQGGFLVQAIAVCKLILQIDPQHSATLSRLSRMTEQRVTGAHGIVPTHDAIPELTFTRNTGPIATVDPRELAMDMLDVPSQPVAVPASVVGAGRSPGNVTFAPAPSPPPGAAGARTQPPTPMPRVAFGTTAPAPDDGSDPDTVPAPPVRGRVATAPIHLAPGAPLDRVDLADAFGAERSTRDDGLSSGVILIPLDDVADDTSPVRIEELSMTDEPDTVDVPLEAIEGPTDEHSFEDISIEQLQDVDDGSDDDEIGLAAPQALSAAARRALSATPLLAGLGPAALAVLVDRLELIHLEKGKVLFKEGDPGDTLFVISEGEVAVVSEGPPRTELSRLLPGAFFGEVALITDAPRSATIVAVANTELMAIDRGVVAELVGQHPDVLRVILRFIKNRLVERVIHTGPLFAPFAERERRSLAERFDFLEIESDTGIIGQGTRPDGLYVLLAGRAEVLRTDHGGGSPRSLGFLGPGEVFGEMALYGSEPSLASVQTRGKVLALRMPASTFREVIMTHPQVLAFVDELAQQRRQEIETPPEDSDDMIDMKLDMI